MISIIVGTNRKESKSTIVAHKISELLRSAGQKSQILELKDLPSEMLHESMYTSDNQHTIISQYQDKYIATVQKFIFVVPEYNGSFPGVLKLFIDAVSVRHYKTNFSGKTAFLVGIASGRLGNAIGLDHLAYVLNYVGASTFPQRLYIPAIDAKVKDTEFQHEGDIGVLTQMLNEFVNY